MAPKGKGSALMGTPKGKEAPLMGAPKGKEAAPPTAPEARDAATVERRMACRFSAPLSIGIVGLPKVGKSKLLNILARSFTSSTEKAISSEVNKLHVDIPDFIFSWLCKHYDPIHEAPPYFELLDTPGLVRGSFVGEGNGNGFLSHIRSVAEIFHILRSFDNKEVPHIEDSINPIRDLETIAEELRIKDREFVNEKISDLEKLMKKGNVKRCSMKQLKDERAFCLKILNYLEDGKDIRTGCWSDLDLEMLKDLNLITAKPVIYLVNMNLKDFEERKNKNMSAVQDCAKENVGACVIPFSCASECNLLDKPENTLERAVPSMVPWIIKCSFKAIGLICFFTASHHEVRCLQVIEQTKAPQAAGAIHPDLERAFVSAEVIKLEDLKLLGSESAVRAAGKYQKVGKTYVVQDGDIIFFKSYKPASTLSSLTDKHARCW